MITLTGIMTDIGGNIIPYALIEIVSTENSGSSFINASITYRCDAGGAYQFTIKPGMYSLYAQISHQSDLEEIGQFAVLDSYSGDYDLETLIELNDPYRPELVIEVENTAAAVQANSDSVDTALEVVQSLADTVNTQAQAVSDNAVLVSGNTATVTELSEQVQVNAASVVESALAASAAATTATEAETSAVASSGLAEQSAGRAAISESNAALSENNAATSEANAAASALSANTAKTTAQASASAAAASEDVAVASETKASTSATNAANSESNAAISEANALSSETLAAEHLTAIQSIYDNFDDRYLGVFASAPVTDNDGNTLKIGAIYFDSSLNHTMFYNGSEWEDPELAATQAAAQAQSFAIASASSETNAANSEAAAELSETNAANSEANASASASAAAISEANAAASEANTQTLAETAANAMNDYIGKTSATGAAVMPAGTEAQRPDAVTNPAPYLRYNTDTGEYEVFNLNSTEWGPVGGAGESVVHSVKTAGQYTLPPGWELPVGSYSGSNLSYDTADVVEIELKKEKYARTAYFEVYISALHASGNASALSFAACYPGKPSIKACAQMRAQDVVIETVSDAFTVEANGGALYFDTAVYNSTNGDTYLTLNHPFRWTADIPASEDDTGYFTIALPVKMYNSSTAGAFDVYLINSSTTAKVTVTPITTDIDIDMTP